MLTLQALEATDVLHLSLERLKQLCAQIPAFERFFRLLFQHAFLLEQRQRLALLHWPAAKRYARFCRQYPRLRQKLLIILWTVNTTTDAAQLAQPLDGLITDYPDLFMTE